MHRQHGFFRLKQSLTLFLALAIGATALEAIAPPAPAGKDGVSRRSPLLAAEPTLEWLKAESAAAAPLPGLSDFLDRYDGPWEIVVDRRSGRLHLLSGAGVPMVEGRAGLAEVERAFRDFLDQFPGLFAPQGLEFALDAERSLPLGDGAWSLELRQVHDGVPVEGAALVVRLKAGRATQIAARRVAKVDLSAAPALSEAAALESALTELGLAAAAPGPATLRFLPTVLPGELPGVPFADEPGSGWQHRLVYTWSLPLTRQDGTLLSPLAQATWRLRVDAFSGEILELADETQHAQATGDIVPTYPTDPLVNVGLPFMEVGLPNLTAYTDAGGHYNYPGAPAQAAARLFGTYAKIYNQCSPGSIWAADWSTGNLNFQGVPQPAAACDAPPPLVAGPGNTNASRTAFYHLSQLRHEARCRLNGSCTGNSPFPDLTTPINVNTDDPILACNAIWFSFGTMSLFREATVGAAQCSNTGVNRAVITHEWGHSLDQHAGGVIADGASREAFADTFAFLKTGDPCIGTGFYVNQTCANCGPTCTGVRDLEVFSVGGARPLARPSTIERADGLNCAPTIYDPSTGADYINCPAGNPQGPMGYQGHCESQIASAANWDLRQNLRARWGAAAGDSIFEELWWDAAVPVGSAYRVVSGGQCNPYAHVDGCADDNWYRVLLQLDDNNGNLADGTPNGCRIFDAYSAHGIACGSRPPCTADAATSCIAPPSAMVGWWPLDTVTAQATPELLASNGALLHGLPFGEPLAIGGRVGPALRFNGNDYLEAADCTYSDIGTNDFTWLAWVRTTQPNGTIVAKRTRSGSNYLGYLLQISSGRPLLQIADAAANWINFPAASVSRVDDGAWHLVAVAVDRDHPSGVRISVDGGAPQVFNPTSRQGSLANTANLRMARSIGDTIERYLNGDLDEVQLYHRALTQAEIQAIFNAGASGVCSNNLPTLQACGGGSN